MWNSFYYFNYNNNFNILFTNFHVINKGFLLVGKKIRLIYKQKFKEKIEITENRIIWTDSRNYTEGLDYTYIQIFNEDGFKIENIFQIEYSNINNYNGIEKCVFYNIQKEINSNLQKDI